MRINVNQLSYIPQALITSLTVMPPRHNATKLKSPNVALYRGSTVLDTKTESRVLIDNLPPRDVKHRLFVGWVSITTLWPSCLCRHVI